jgi:hypothetical protein
MLAPQEALGRDGSTKIRGVCVLAEDIVQEHSIPPTELTSFSSTLKYRPLRIDLPLGKGVLWTSGHMHMIREAGVNTPISEGYPQRDHSRMLGAMYQQL